MTLLPLDLVVCGAPLAARSPEVAAALAADGWDVSEIVTDAALGWRDAPTPRVRSDQRPRAVLALPLSFNTASKVAAGVMDTPACGALCEALGAGTPLFLVSTVNDLLWGHPAWPATVRIFSGAGSVWLDPIRGVPAEPHPIPSGSGPAMVDAIDVDAIVRAVRLPARECG